MQSSLAGPVIALLGLCVACGTTTASVPGDDSSGGGSSTTTTSTSSSSTTDVEASTSNASTSSSSGDPLDGVPPGFLNPLDDGSSYWECSPWLEECPEGEKCMPYANDGGSAWNAMRCSPLAPDPGQPGEPCTVDSSEVSGVDDCALHSVCWDVDPETLEGTCRAMCLGSETTPACAAVDEFCTGNGEGTLNLCLPICDPIAQDCGVGDACYPVHDFYACAPDASGDGGGSFESCAYINGCDPGFACASVPLCGDVPGCCVPFCALSDPTCPDGTTCVAWLDPGEAPIGFEDVGICGGEA